MRAPGRSALGARTSTPVAALLLAVLALVLGGPLLDSAGDPLETVARPFAPPGPGLPWGADVLGRDVLARVLAGGRDLTLTALAAAAAATTLGTAAGLWAGWARGAPSAGAVTRLTDAAADLLLAVPLLLLALLAAVSLPGPAAVVAATVVGGAPLTARVLADTTAAARHSGYVEAALSRGERPRAVLLREVLPAHAGTVMADLATRTVLAVQLAAALSALGFGPAPPSPDWGVMLRENLRGVGLNPLALVAPAMALALLAGAVALLAVRPARSS